MHQHDKRAGAAIIVDADTGVAEVEELVEVGELEPDSIHTPGIYVQRIVDIYEKEGSQGPLIFTVRALRVTDAAGELVLEEIQTSIAR